MPPISFFPAGAVGAGAQNAQRLQQPFTQQAELDRRKRLAEILKAGSVREGDPQTGVAAAGRIAQAISSAVLNKKTTKLEKENETTRGNDLAAAMALKDPAARQAFLARSKDPSLRDFAFDRAIKLGDITRKRVEDAKLLEADQLREDAKLLAANEREDEKIEAAEAFDRETRNTDFENEKILLGIKSVNKQRNGRSPAEINIDDAREAGITPITETEQFGVPQDEDRPDSPFDDATGPVDTIGRFLSNVAGIKAIIPGLGSQSGPAAQRINSVVTLLGEAYAPSGSGSDRLTKLDFELGKNIPQINRGMFANQDTMRSQMAGAQLMVRKNMDTIKAQAKSPNFDENDIAELQKRFDKLSLADAEISSLISDDILGQENEDKRIEANRTSAADLRERAFGTSDPAKAGNFF